MPIAAVALSVCMALPSTPLAAQDGGMLSFVGFSAGYLTLSVTALARLVGNGTTARVGDDVRFRHSTIRGVIERIDADSLTVRAGGGETRLARPAGGEIMVLRGTERKWAQGWAIGLGAGAAFGAIAAHHDPPANCDFFCPTANQASVLAGVAGGLAGSLVGAAVGAAVSGEHWMHATRIDAAPRVTVEPDGRATRLGVRVSF